MTSREAARAAIEARFGWTKNPSRRAGLCYEIAAQAHIALSHAGVETTLVHGRVHNEGASARVVAFVDHAWLEFEHGGAQWIWEPTEDEVWATADYEQQWGVIRWATYSREEATAAMLTAGHYGAWDEGAEARRKEQRKALKAAERARRAYIADVVGAVDAWTASEEGQAVIAELRERVSA